jgi:PAS domain S-box-containing protein
MPSTLQEWVWWSAILAPTGAGVYLLTRLVKGWRSAKAWVTKTQTAFTTLDRIDESNVRTEARQLAMFASSAIAAFETDKNGEFALVNRAFELLTGYGEKALLGNGWVNVVHPQDADDFMRNFKHAIADERIFRRSIRFLTERDEIIKVCVDMQPMSHNGHGIVGWSGTVEREEERTLLERVTTLEHTVFVGRRAGDHG